MLNKLLGRSPVAVPVRRVPAGERIYAVGDVHGRVDLLDRLLALIDADDDARGPALTHLVFLGDLIDRGPDSAAVVERLRRLAAARPRARFLFGNHEEVFLAAMAGDERALRGFCRIGGRETALSYGIDAAQFERMDHAELFAALQAAVPPEHVGFVAGFETSVTIGDYMFVHAGVDPAQPLNAQMPADLRWIREPFLRHPRPLAKMIVHGHTIHADVEWHPHRIGIDTGAYDTGRLTALGLEGESRWTLQS